jgi:Sap, sulfolipid-1-addressing protein
MVFDLILLGLAITLDPLPLTGFFIVLPSKRGTRKGAAFVFGWLVSLAIVVSVTLLATGNNPPRPSTAPSLAALAVKIALGTALVVIAARHYQSMGGRSRRSGRRTWTPCPRGSPWAWLRRCSPGC